MSSPTRVSQCAARIRASGAVPGLAAIAAVSLLAVGLPSLESALFARPILEPLVIAILAGMVVRGAGYVRAAAQQTTLSGQVATAVKLARVLMLGPVVAFFAVRTRREPASTLSVLTFVPWFVIGFVLLATLRSTGVLSARAGEGAKLVAGWLTIASMAALGLSVGVRSVRQVGTRVVAAVLGSLVVLTLLAVAIIRALGVR